MIPPRLEPRPQKEVGFIRGNTKFHVKVIDKDFSQLNDAKDLVATSFGNLLASQMSKDASRMIAEEREYWEFRVKRFSKFVSEYKVEHRAAFARDSKDKVIGFVLWKFMSPKKVKIDMLCVDSNCRRCGIGKILIEFVLGSEPDKVSLHTPLYDNDVAIKFYEKLGFVAKSYEDYGIEFVLRQSKTKL